MIPEPHGCLDTDSRSCSDGNTCQRLVCAAPHPRLNLTGERFTWIPSLASDGTRAPISF